MAIDAAAFGPSQPDVSSRTGWAQYSPYVKAGLGLANLFRNPTTDNAAKFIGSTITSPQLLQSTMNLFGAGSGADAAAGAGAATGAAGTGASGMTSADWASLAGSAASIGSAFVDDPYAKVGLATVGYGASAFANPFMAAWGAPQFADSIDKILDGQETEIRRAQRTRDANALTGEFMQGLNGLDLAADVGGATVGDTLASILNFNLGGGWAPGAGTSLGWLPDPALLGLQGLLNDRGYLGTRVENGEIVRREPTRNNVGGVGEMVAGGGLTMRNPAAQPRLRELIDGFKMTDQQAVNSLEDLGIPTTLGGAQAWNLLLRQLAGVPASAPSVWDFTPQAITDDATLRQRALKSGLDPTKAPAAYESWKLDSPQATNPYEEYMALLEETLPDAAARLRAAASSTGDGGGSGGTG